MLVKGKNEEKTQEMFSKSFFLFFSFFAKHAFYFSSYKRKLSSIQESNQHTYVFYLAFIHCHSKSPPILKV